MKKLFISFAAILSVFILGKLVFAETVADIQPIDGESLNRLVDAVGSGSGGGVATTDSRLYGATTNYVLSGNGAGLNSTYKALPAAATGNATTNTVGLQEWAVGETNNLNGPVNLKGNWSLAGTATCTNIIGDFNTYQQIEIRGTNAGNTFLTYALKIGDNFGDVGYIGCNYNFGSLYFSGSDGAAHIIFSASSTLIYYSGTKIFGFGDGGTGNHAYSTSSSYPSIWFDSIGKATSFKADNNGAAFPAAGTNLVGGTIVIANTSVTTSDIIVPAILAPGGVPGVLYARCTNNGSYYINSSSGADTSLVRPIIFGTH